MVAFRWNELGDYMMKLRMVLLVLLAFFADYAVSIEKNSVSPTAYTEWSVTPAAGLDALLLIGAASGDVMQADIYSDEIARFRHAMSSEGLAAMDQIDAMLRGQMGRLTGPVLAYFFSAGPVATIDDVIESAADPVTRLRPKHLQSPQWNEKEFDAAMRMMPTLHIALVSLRNAGFSDWYDLNLRPRIEKAVEVNQRAVQPFDIIPEQERLLGRKLDPMVEIFVANYSKPYGIKILGQRFIAHYSYEGTTQLRIAAHEIFHSPFSRQDSEMLDLLKPLENDTWMTSIVDNHDPKFGYNSFLSIVDEDSTQALDQIVSERLEFADDPGERWRQSDGGMHVLAAAIYHAMKEDNFANLGGEYSVWLKSALRRGLLSPESVRLRAEQIVGQDTVDQWYRDGDD